MRGRTITVTLWETEAQRAGAGQVLDAAAARLLAPLATTLPHTIAQGRVVRNDLGRVAAAP